MADNHVEGMCNFRDLGRTHIIQSRKPNTRVFNASFISLANADEASWQRGWEEFTG